MTNGRSLSDQLGPLADRMRRNASNSRQIVKVTAELIGDDKNRAVNSARAEILRWLQARVGILPENAWSGESFEHMAPGRFAAGVRLAGDDFEYWCIRCDDPDKDIPARTWTTEASLGRLGDRASFGLRLTMATTEPEPIFTPSVPGVVRQLADNPGLISHNRPVSAQPIIIKEDEDVGELVHLLLDPRRRRPVYVVSLGEGETDLRKAAINFTSLAARCMGIAHVAVITGPMTYGLTDFLSKPLSTFGGAVRTYHPGMIEDDDPYRHPLALPGRIEHWQETGREAFVDMLVANAAAHSIRVISDETELLPFTKVRQGALQKSRELRKQEGADNVEMLKLAEDEINEKKQEIDEVLALAQEEERQRLNLETHLNQTRSTNDFLRKRVLDLEARLHSALHAPVEEPLPKTLEGLKDWADHALPGRLQISARAQRDAKNGKFNDPKLVCRCLQVLGNEYRHMRLEGGSEAESACDVAFQNLGVQNTRSGTAQSLKKEGDTFEITWRNEKHLLQWHLKNGGNTRDPSRCLRIYYFWDEEDEQVVVGSLPGHLETKLS